MVLTANLCDAPRYKKFGAREISKCHRVVPDYAVDSIVPIMDWVKTQLKRRSAP